MKKKISTFTILILLLTGVLPNANALNENLDILSLSSSNLFSKKLKTINTYSLLNSQEDLSKRRRSKSKRGRNCYAAGTTTITLGYGFPNITKMVWGSVYSAYDEVNVTGYGPLHLKAEYGLSDVVSLGVSVGYVHTQWDWTVEEGLWQNVSTLDPYGNTIIQSQYITQTYKEGIIYSALNVNVRANFHFLTTKKLDPYFGVGLGYNKATITTYSDDPNYAYNESISSPIPLGFETTLGLRYYFTPNIGIYTEAGLSKSILQGGLSIKF